MLKTGHSALVKTTTKDPDNALGNRKACWLAPFLHYEFTLNDSNAMNVRKNEVTFSALERVVPLRFEFEVGRLIDDWFFDWGTEALTDGYDQDYKLPA